MQGMANIPKHDNLRSGRRRVALRGAAGAGVGTQGTLFACCIAWACRRPSSRAHPVDQGRAILPVLLLAHPHLVEGAERGEDRSAHPS